MLYTDLNDITLSRFIDIYNGNNLSVVKGGIHSEKELTEAAEKLIYEYIGIVGGKSIQSEINQKNELLNTRTYIQVLSRCQTLIKLDKWDDVCEVLGILGYNFKPDNHEGMKSRIDALIPSMNMKYDLLKSGVKPKSDNKKDPDYFTKEIALIMTHFKMHIDESVISAKKYAYIVKRMSDEVEASNSVMRKMKK